MTGMSKNISSWIAEFLTREQKNWLDYPFSFSIVKDGLGQVLILFGITIFIIQFNRNLHSIRDPDVEKIKKKLDKKIPSIFLSKYFRTACFFGIFSAVMIIFFRYEEKNINNILVTHFQILFFTTTIGIFIPKYYIHQNENLILYVKLYHQIPAPVLPWQLPENFDLKSVTFDYASYNSVTFHNVNLVIHKQRK